MPLWQRVHRAWLRLGGPAAYSEERDLLDAQQFIQALATEPHPELLAGDAFDEFAAELYAAPAFAAAAGTVDVLTMHGAKGLEWDVVIVPGIGRSAAQRSRATPALARTAGQRRGFGAAALAHQRRWARDNARSLARYIQRLRKQRARLETGTPAVCRGDPRSAATALVRCGTGSP